ncbi:MAG: M20 family metallopeptidase [Myxococcales bacterium]|nr:MAG: M20 family metallopeptidase [Myxococcales bacterium]
MSQDLASRILDHLDENRTAMFELLEKLVLCESPSGDPSAQREVMRLLSESFEQRRFRPQILSGKDSGGMLLAMPAERKRHRPHQLILGHCDTVWPIGTLETMPARTEGGTFWGPGSYDMKAGLVQGLFAIEALAQAGANALPVTPVFFINSDEEIGSHDSTRLIVRFARGADRCFVLEPSLGPAGDLKTARTGVGRFWITVRGVAAHAGLDPGKGASAILELSHIIQKLFALNDPDKGITVNVGTIDGGLSPNMVAPESKAAVDVRVPTREDADRIERTIHALQADTPGTEVTVEGAVRRPPMERTPGNVRLWQLAQRGAEELGIEIDQAAAGGGSDGNTTSLFTPTLDGLGAVGAGAHAETEHLLLDKMVERSALLARLLSYPPLDDAIPKGD